MRLFLFLFFLATLCPAQSDFLSLQKHLQHQLDSMMALEERPGATLAIVLPDGRLISLATGFSDLEEQTPMPVGGQMLTGSTGKIFVSTVALQLIGEGKFSLDDKVGKFFQRGEEDHWFDRLPNAPDLTIRSLMSHTSGLPRYVFQESFLKAVKDKPLRSWTPEECLSIVLDLEPRHPAGQGWGYSDTNYILLGMVLERVTGETFYDLAEKRILRPCLLRHTYPSTQRELPGLVPGYIGENNFFDLPPKTVKNEKYVMNPQFEWTGGGFVTNVEDLAFLVKWLHDGKLVPPVQYAELVNAYDLKTGERSPSGYGLGTFVWSTDEGIFYGHAGIMPGHLTQVEYAKEYGFSVALQVNTDEGLGRTHHAHVQYFAKIIIDYLNAGIKKKMESDEAGIMANFIRQVECWNQGDIDCYMEGYFRSDSIQTISRGRVTYGYETIQQNYRKNYPPDQMGELYFDNLVMTRLSDEYYYVVGRYNLVYPDKPEPLRGSFSVIMQKINGQWLMVSDHSG